MGFVTVDAAYPVHESVVPGLLNFASIVDESVTPDAAYPVHSTAVPDSLTADPVSHGAGLTHSADAVGFDEFGNHTADHIMHDTHMTREGGDSALFAANDGVRFLCSDECRPSCCCECLR